MIKFTIICRCSFRMLIDDERQNVVVVQHLRHSTSVYSPVLFFGFVAHKENAILCSILNCSEQRLPRAVPKRIDEEFNCKPFINEHESELLEKWNRSISWIKRSLLRAIGF